MCFLLARVYVWLVRHAKGGLSLVLRCVAFWFRVVCCFCCWMNGYMFVYVCGCVLNSVFCVVLVVGVLLDCEWGVAVCCYLCIGVCGWFLRCYWFVG